MPNVYASLSKLKSRMPDGFQATTTKYDAALLSLLDTVSRGIDERCARKFYPEYGVRYFTGSGDIHTRVSDLIGGTIEYSEDGETFTTLAAADWIGTVFGDENHPASWNEVELPIWTDAPIGTWPAVRRGLKITGWWGFCASRSEAWQSTGQTLPGNITSAATSITVTSVTATDPWGLEAAFQVGRLIRIDDEVMEVTVVTDGITDSITVVRGRNGSTAAAHSTGAAISYWRAPSQIEQATVISAVRQFERGLQGFGDLRVTPEMGQIQWVRKLDPDVEVMVGQFINRWCY